MPSSSTLDPDVWLYIFGHRVPYLEAHNTYALPSRDERQGIEPEPLHDVWAVLALLVSRQGDSAKRFVQIEHPTVARAAATVRIEIFNGGYTKEELSDTREFPITMEVVTELRDKGFVCGTPKWGYTDENELKLTSSGLEALVSELPRLNAALPTGIRGESE